MHSSTLFSDADNTLWDTDGVFAAAQMELLEAVEMTMGTKAITSDRLAFVRALDQGLAERHHSGLRYPPRLLGRALALALAGVECGRAVRTSLGGAPAEQSLSEEQAILAERSFIAGISRVPPLRAGVLEGLETLLAAGCLVLVVTEGVREKVAAIATGHGIARFLDRIIESPKRPQLYRRVLRLAGSPERACMVGDQLDRDIRPARAAGLETIYFPGGFRPKWTPSEEAVLPDHVITSFAEVAEIVVEDRQVPAAIGY